jgi:hypothetical protein
VRMKRIARQYIVMRELLTYEESMSLVGSITKDEIDAELAYLDRHAAYNLLVFGCRDVVKYRKYNLAMRGKE